MMKKTPEKTQERIRVRIPVKTRERIRAKILVKSRVVPVVAMKVARNASQRKL